MNNITWHRIKAIILRTLLKYKQNTITIVEVIFWPILDIIVWGTMGMWVTSSTGQHVNVAAALLTGIVFWEMTIRSIYEISITTTREISSKSLMSLFTTPLTMGEWIIGLMLSSLISVFASIIYCSIIVWLIYSINIFAIGWTFIPFSILLTMFGWTVGFLGAGIIIYWGITFEAISWMSLWFFAPFSAVYYPVESLPAWIKTISVAVPSSYVFEGMRLLLYSNVIPWNFLLKSLFLNIIYLTGSIMFFIFMFNKSRKKGLARL